uniref:Uncharacterized protein n=1 Tax=uncultured Armatimonadetes bacterium TaxID=157466 RepID=A0A6J4HMS1_9BACT|nr:hypothetical protein AVDCRST_MAG63-882 [uncultured Armatimonadetes bacterium]
MDEAEQAGGGGETTEGRSRSRQVAITAVFWMDADSQEEATERALEAVLGLKGEATGFWSVGAFYAGPEGKEMAALPGSRRYPIGEEFQDG